MINKIKHLKYSDSQKKIDRSNETLSRYFEIVIGTACGFENRKTAFKKYAKKCGF